MFRGFEREVDSVGRIVLPKQIRKEMGIDEPGSVVSMVYNGKELIVKKAVPECVLCLNTDNLVEIGGKFLCRTCIEKIKSE